MSTSSSTGASRRALLAILTVLVVMFVVVYRFWPRASASGGASSSNAAVATTHFALHLAAVDSAVTTNQSHPLLVDLYAPAGAQKRLPVLIFLQGNDPPSLMDPDRRSIYAADVADALTRNGMATFSISFNADKDYTLRRAALDVAKVIEEIDRTAPDGIKPTRIVLAGRGVGAWMATLLTLDRTLFEEAKFDPKKIAGVIALRGTYDLSDLGLDGHPHAAFYAAVAGASGDSRRDVSPIEFARANAPPILLLTGSTDQGHWPRLARSFANALEKAHASVESFVVPEHDHHNLTHWSGEKNDLGELAMSFIRSGFEPLLPIENGLGVRERWTKKPPLDNDDLRGAADRVPITTYAVDAQFKSTLAVMFDRFPGELNILPGKTYEAIDLATYLASRGQNEVGKGDYLTITNLRDEKTYLTRDDLEKTKPVIVVGMDDETNLNRLFGYYHLNLLYSWKKNDETPPMMIRPLGAFLHFRTAPPAHLRNKSLAPYGLSAKSFTFTETDPLAAVSDLTGSVRDAMIGDQGCLRCHSFRDVGSRAHHTQAIDAKSHGAFALPLEEYPTDVLRRFLFEQDAVAASFNVTPLRVDPVAAKGIFELVTKKK